VTHDGEICAALPMTQVGLTAWYCHSHQGWCWSAHVYRQGHSDEVEVLHSSDGDLGPFDDPAELRTRWDDMMARARQHIDGGTV
jgi:hypothetical protein